MSRNQKHWTKVNSTELFKSGFFRFRCDTMELPDKRICPRYYVMEFRDWVNIVPVTPDGKLIMIKQYRPPVEEVCLEIPGGSMGPQAETPEEAALRELVEETGYVPREMKFLGSHRPNPALQTNTLWTYLAIDCELKSKQELDEFEDIDVVPMEVDEVLQAIHEGQITHSLVIAGIFYALPYLKKFSKI